MLGNSVDKIDVEPVLHGFERFGREQVLDSLLSGLLERPVGDEPVGETIPGDD